jgi:peptidoglycan/xylan/chitin deacetylase (PgdA/CDA1 family)
MQDIDRRTLLYGMAVAALAAASCSPLARSQKPAAPVGVLTRLPGNGNQLALTIDDGTSVAVVGAFAQFCRDSGTRLTFFVNGVNSSWSVNAPALRPMVDSGQIQMGNHTWSHPYLNRIRHSAVADQLSRNADFLKNTYGTDGTPYWRPPYGVHNADIDRVAADLGYTTITLWSGDIGNPVSDESSLIAAASKSFQPQQIVIGHANLPTVTHCFPQLLDLIHSRNLQTVTLNDVFA